MKKRKYIKWITVVCFAVLISVTILINKTKAEMLMEGDYQYEVLSDQTVKLTDYSGSDSEVVIPTMLAGK